MYIVRSNFYLRKKKKKNYICEYRLMYACKETGKEPHPTLNHDIEGVYNCAITLTSYFIPLYYIVHAV